MDGIAVAQVIREHYSIPIVFLTALAGDSIMNQTNLAEPFRYIIKHFGERELRTVIELALGKQRTK
jgi:CheY-like chemotaxis protein